MNKWIGIGRICNDPEIRTTQEGKPVAKYRLAVSRAFKREGHDEADFLNCVVFGKGAEFVQNYLGNGMKIAVEGSIRTGSYDKDGVRHYTTEIMVERQEFCESKNVQGDADDSQFIQQPQKQQQAQQINAFVQVDDDDDLPF